MEIRCLASIGVPVTIVLSSCGKLPETEVTHSGALRTMMSGHLQATAILDTLRQKQNFFAIGAAENLKGEIQIFDGRPLNSRVYNDEIVLDKSFGKKAALLVYAQVAKWQNIELPKSVNSSEKREEFSEQKAIDRRLNTIEPFPFMIEGSVKLLKWHVIDWEEDETVHSHQKHKETVAHGVLENEKVAIIGFYSQSHQNVFTHRSTFIRMHFKSKNEQIAGHVDSLQLGSTMTLKLPKI